MVKYGGADGSWRSMVVQMDHGEVWWSRRIMVKYGSADGSW